MQKTTACLASLKKKKEFSIYKKTSTMLIMILSDTTLN